MRGIGRTLSRLPAARAFLAGAAILASTSLRPAQAESPSAGQGGGDETAMAVPRVAPPAGRSGVGLPQPLAPSEAARIRRIFALQARGAIPAAVAETDRLTDTTLLGHILADRYLHKSTRVTAPELSDWLGRYADLPDAPAIYRLLLAATPPGAIPPPAPATMLFARQTGDPGFAEDDPAAHAIARNPTLDRWVLGTARAGHAVAALRLLDRARGVGVLYDAELRAEVAQILFTGGHDRAARVIGEESWRRTDGRLGLGAYVGGLAAWRGGAVGAARMLFAAAAAAPLASESLHAGAAFWAGRSALRDGDPGSWRPWMQRAAASPRSFYGLLARRSLGEPVLAAPEPVGAAVAGEADMAAVADTPQGRRAFALLQVGETARAEAELRALWPTVVDPALRRAIRVVAEAAGLSPLATEFAASEAELVGAGGTPPRLAPRGGFVLNPALVYALTRVESNFDPAAVSGAGAHGLMQIMPATAGSVAGNPSRFLASAEALHDPALNLQLGQRYVVSLGTGAAARDGGSDLLRLLASYNAGPNAVAHWAIDDEGDPLLYLESIPIDETRGFVTRTLSYLWLYAAEMHLPTESLDALAAGAWPRFGPELRHAEAGRS